MKSAVYKPGVECRAENKKAGGVWYWPYYNGQRLEVPKEEWKDWGIEEPEPVPPQPTPTPTPTPDPINSSTHTIDDFNNQAAQIAAHNNETYTTMSAAQNQVTDTANASDTVQSVIKEVPVAGDNVQQEPNWKLIFALCLAGCGIISLVFYLLFGRRRRTDATE